MFPEDKEAEAPLWMTFAAHPKRKCVAIGAVSEYTQDRCEKAARGKHPPYMGWKLLTLDYMRGPEHVGVTLENWYKSQGFTESEARHMVGRTVKMVVALVERFEEAKRGAGNSASN